MALFTQILLSLAFLGQPEPFSAPPDGVEEKKMETVQIRVVITHADLEGLSGEQKRKVRKDLADELRYQLPHHTDKKAEIKVDLGEEYLLEVSDPDLHSAVEVYVISFLSDLHGEELD